MSKKNLLIWSSVFVLIFFTFFLLLSTAIALTILFFSSTTEDLDSNTLISKQNKYRYTEFDPDTNSISRGIVSLQKTLLDSEYVTYPTPNGGEAMISRFETNEYSCTGSCYCAPNSASDEERRLTLKGWILLSQGVVILLATAPYWFLKIAEMKLMKRCRAQFEEDCVDGKVMAYIDECKENGMPETSPYKDFTPVLPEEEAKTGTAPEAEAEEEKESIKTAELMCESVCQPITPPEGEERPIPKEFQCSDLQLIQQITVPHQGGLFKYIIQKTLLIDRAKETFVNQYLNHFCRQQSTEVKEDGSEVTYCEGAPGKDFWSGISLKNMYGHTVCLVLEK